MLFIQIQSLQLDSRDWTRLSYYDYGSWYAEVRFFSGAEKYVLQHSICAELLLVNLN